VVGLDAAALRFVPPGRTLRAVRVPKFNKSWAGMYYRVELGLIDGSSRTLDVQFTK